MGYMQSHFLTLAKAAARRAANVASAFFALSLAGRGLGMPVAFEALPPAYPSHMLALQLQVPGQSNFELVRQAHCTDHTQLANQGK